MERLVLLLIDSRGLFRGFQLELLSRDPPGFNVTVLGR